MLPNKSYSILSSLLVLLLTSCSGNEILEGSLAPDPQLQQDSQVVPTPEPTTPPKETQTQLPDDFPPDIPIYPGAKLLETQPGKTRWQSSDPSNAIENYYQKELENNNWQLSSQENNTLVASRDDLEVTVSIVSVSPTTEFAIAYSTTTPLGETNPTPTTPETFSDLEEAPEQLRKYIENLGALGVVTGEEGKFQPQEIITRREYARWLVNANNRMYANEPGKQIRLAANTAEPAYTDVSQTDPDFAVIQGLAEAGLIPSRLSGDSTALNFRPVATLTREDLIFWKVPLDIRKALPTATIESIKETWGFQDAAEISPLAMRSLYADFQNGELANVRRVFGYTTLFQPKKPVTRAEAAAALWYFGYQGDGRSAEEVLQTVVKNP
ncbi:MAG: S-layer homology domain-containing protein [Gomphosphaeria aponina SAG 52.96 = DSM 107014]|uniref:S-layer homology domain-containing protein n=1 Tax=Gomphosphaeria aponina SAG 52.96 = DSM 107014 TaxID=1521640 RepID=A0A941GTM7_9CHRO|nr:S-layer homology domain-containing protein [Gomphosphaeria aponina SAG 52.96 = DSM 107014]